MHDAKTNLSKIIDRVEKTRQPEVIARRGKPVAKIVALENASGSTLAGALRGQISYAADFDQSDKEIEILFQ